MKALLIFGLVSHEFAQEIDLSLLSSKELKKRLKNESKLERRSQSSLLQRSNSIVTTAAQLLVDRTHSCALRQVTGIDTSS